ncbi:MAG: hypothetical protein IKS07_02520 [Lachnospiraceae bacterium]|nr:hypothetical protein [Lachnospiraceae bacterium]
MKTFKNLFLSVAACALFLVLTGAGTLRAQAATNYCIYPVNGEWKYSVGDYAANAGTYALSGLPSVIKDGDTVAVLGTSTNKEVSVNVTLARVDYVGTSGLVLYTKGIAECNVTSGSAVAVHGGVEQAKVYGTAAVTFYDDVQELSLPVDAGLQPTCNINCLGTVAHALKTEADANNFHVYNVQKGRLDIQNGVLRTDAKYYATTPSATNASSEASKWAPVFNAVYYASVYPDLKAAFGYDESALLKHFLTYGMKEGRQATAGFNVQAYKARYEDLQKAFGDDLSLYYRHYVEFGKAEKRSAT